ncbi:MAG: hypothetical protein IJW81_01915 [Clostridia bacterium]|nr:hypothetical protein [Clostridia bacterium]
MKRTLALLLALFVVLPGMIACGDTDEPTADNTGASVSADAAAEETVPVETEPERLSDDLPDTDLEGWTMRILSHHDPLSDESTFYAYELTGEVVNDAIYERDAAVKERFNCEFALTPGNGWATDINMLLNSVNAGSRDYDVSFLLPFASNGSVITNNALYNMLYVDHINFEKPWWHTDMNNQYTIGGYLPFVSSDYLISSYQYANALIFNKDIVTNYGIENMYELVKAGTWTFDKFKQLIEIPTQDVDGDGVFTDADSYGFATNFGYHAITWGYAIGDVSVHLDSGEVQLGYGNERFYSMAQWLYDILYNSNVTFEIGWDKDCTITWDTDRVFIQAVWLADMEKFRDCETDYGILPYPKYDEGQDKYYTYVDARAGSLGIPIDVPAEVISKVGMILEAQSCASYYDTLPLYMNSIQNSRYTRDQDSIDMIGYIGEGRRWDIGYSFSGGDSTYVWAIYRHLKTSGGQIVSSLEKLSKPMIKRFEEILEAYQSLAEKQW